LFWFFYGRAPRAETVIRVNSWYEVLVTGRITV